MYAREGAHIVLGLLDNLDEREPHLQAALWACRSRAVHVKAANWRSYMLARASATTRLCKVAASATPARARSMIRVATISRPC